MPTKIFVGNLGDGVRSDDILPLFEKHGEVEECDVLTNFGFVHMVNEDDAKAAIKALNGYNLQGERMRVELSTGGGRGNPNRGRRGSGRDFHRDRPYPPGPPGRYPPPPPPGLRRPPPPDLYDPYYRDLLERDPYFRLPPDPRDRYLPPLDRYHPLRRLYPEDRYLPLDPRDRYLAARERLPPYDDLYERLRAERLADPYFRERSPLGSRPPPEYYDRKSALREASAPSATPGAAGQAANGSSYDYYSHLPAESPAQRAGFNGPTSSAGGQKAAGGYPSQQQQYGQQQRPQPRMQQGPQGPQGNYNQSSLQTKPVFF